LPDVDVARLPRTAYARLIGREAVIARLDSAWAGSDTAVVSLAAEGGAGKSAIINEWLARVEADAWRGAEAVLGWSLRRRVAAAPAGKACGLIVLTSRLAVEVSRTGAIRAPRSPMSGG
jgi:hypothetical protein